ncbi:hypothetical protein PENTCL1PPCAC_30605, partial [Pristionchus entomophagus]
ETPVADSVYLTDEGITVDGSIMGWFATDLKENHKNDDVSVTVLRMPINKVHSLATLASDAVNRLISKEMRERITKKSNPKSIAQYVRAIISV